jgi:hypothetical protein
MVSVTTASILSMFDFPEHYIKQRAKRLLQLAKAKHDCVFRPVEHPKEIRVLTEEESIFIHEWIVFCDFNLFLYHDNTALYIRNIEPPAGYAATCHENAPFIPHLYHQLFHGFGMITIEGNIKVGMVAKWKAALNALLKDASSVPATLQLGVRGAWYPSLGRNGWIAICRCFNPMTGKHSFVLYMYGGLDESTYEEMENVMYRCYQEERTMKDTFEILRPYREISLENMKRVFYVVTTHLPGIGRTSSATVEHSPAIVMDPTPNSTTKGISAEEYAWLDTQYVQHPESLSCMYTIPRDASFRKKQTDPLQQEEKPSSLELAIRSTLSLADPEPKGIVPEMHVFTDDVVPYKHDPSHRLRLSHACEMQGKVIRMDDPRTAVNIYTIKAESEFDTSPWLHAYPAVATMTPPSSSENDEEEETETKIGSNTDPQSGRQRRRQRRTQSSLISHGQEMDHELIFETNETTNSPHQPYQNWSPIPSGLANEAVDHTPKATKLILVPMFVRMSTNPYFAAPEEEEEELENDFKEET